MIAVDSNVLLRRILNDDATQSRKAHALFDSEVAVLITDVVLTETVWTLAGKRYQATSEQVAEVVTSLLQEGNVLFESQPAVWAALNDFLGAATTSGAARTKSPDFADALIVRKARQVAQNLGEDYEGTYTFDLGALKLQGTREP